MMGKKVCFIYCRQSSGQDDSDASLSIRQQFENCQAFAQKENLIVAGVFTDANISGKTYPAGERFEKIAANDPAFNEWFAQQTGQKKFRTGLGDMFARLNEVDYIVLDEITRLHRSTARSFLEQTISYFLCEKKVQILQVKGGIIDLSKFDQALIQMLRTQINDEQIRNQKNKSKESKILLKNSGIYLGSKFFGCVYEGKKQFHFDPEKAEVIKLIYGELLSGISGSELCARINRDFLPLFAPARLFYETTLRHIVTNPIYAGYIYNSSGELIRCRNAPEPLIEIRDFLQVRQLLATRQRLKVKTPAEAFRRHFLPLSGLLRCGHCGSKLVVGFDRGKVFYQCKRRIVSRDRLCSGSRILSHDETGTRKWASGLKDFLPAFFPLFFYLQSHHLQELEQAEQRISGLQQKIVCCQQKLTFAFEQFRDDLLDLETYQKITCSTMEMIRDWKKEIFSLKSEEDCDLEHAKQELLRRFQQFLLTPSSLTEPEYTRLLYGAIESVTVYDAEVLVRTPLGELTIPRKNCSSRLKVMPEWKIRSITGDPAIPMQVFFVFGTKTKAVLIGQLGPVSYFSD